LEALGFILRGHCSYVIIGKDQTRFVIFSTRLSTVNSGLHIVSPMGDIVSLDLHKMKCKKKQRTFSRGLHPGSSIHSVAEDTVARVL